MKSLKFLLFTLLITPSCYATDISAAMEAFVFESFRRALLGNIEIILDATSENDENAFLDGLDSLETFRPVLDKLYESDSTNTQVESLLEILDIAKKERQKYPDEPFFDPNFYNNLPEGHLMKYWVMPFTTLFLIAKEDAENLEFKQD